jgi:hypothetical protein
VAVIGPGGAVSSLNSAAPSGAATFPRGRHALGMA